MALFGRHWPGNDTPSLVRLVPCVAVPFELENKCLEGSPALPAILVHRDPVTALLPEPEAGLTFRPLHLWLHTELFSRGTCQQILLQALQGKVVIV